MLVRFTDFGGGGAFFANGSVWPSIASALGALPYYVCFSGQDGRQSELVFDPKRTNAAIDEALGACGCIRRPRLPAGVSAFGKDFDHCRDGVVIEAQFANYPYLTNNVVRTEIAARLGVQVAGVPVRALVIVARAKMFGAAQGVLSYEQACGQVALMGAHGLVTLPTRVVGLFAPIGAPVPVVRSEYAHARSRDVVGEEHTTKTF